MTKWKNEIPNVNGIYWYKSEDDRDGYNIVQVKVQNGTLRFRDMTPLIISMPIGALIHEDKICDLSEDNDHWFSASPVLQNVPIDLKKDVKDGILDHDRVWSIRDICSMGKEEADRIVRNRRERIITHDADGTIIPHMEFNWMEIHIMTNGVQMICKKCKGKIVRYPSVCDSESGGLLHQDLFKKFYDAPIDHNHNDSVFQIEYTCPKCEYFFNISPINECNVCQWEGNTKGIIGSCKKMVIEDLPWDYPLDAYRKFREQTTEKEPMAKRSKGMFNYVTRQSEIIESIIDLNDEESWAETGLTKKSIRSFFTEHGYWNSDKITYDGYCIKTNLRSILFLISNDQSCYENWGYFSTMDEADDHIGKELLKIEIINDKRELLNQYAGLNGAIESNTGYGIEHIDLEMVSFVKIETTGGTFVLTIYNQHNGYYSHDIIFAQVFNDSPYELSVVEEESL